MQKIRYIYRYVNATILFHWQVNLVGFINSLPQGIRQLFLNFIIKMFINRDGWDNAEKVSKAHVGKEKQLHGKSEELGNDSFQS